MYPSFTVPEPEGYSQEVTKRCMLHVVYLGRLYCPQYISDNLEKKRRNCWGTAVYHWLCATVRMEPKKQTILLCIFRLGLQLTKFVYCSFLCTGSRYLFWERLRLVLIFIFVCSVADPDPIGSA